MTLEELNAAREAATRNMLLEGEWITKAQDLLDVVGQFGAVGESAEHVRVTLAHFVSHASAFLNRTAPQEPAVDPAI